MTGDLHAAIGAALDREQAEAESVAARVARQDPARTLRRIEADRRVRARHAPAGGAEVCVTCLVPYPCPDLLDLAARLDVQVTP